MCLYYLVKGKMIRSFDADAYCEQENFVIGGSRQRRHRLSVLKGSFSACMMHEVSYLTIAVRNKYRNSHDYEKVQTFLKYASQRLALPLKGILIIGVNSTTRICHEFILSLV